VTSSLAVFKAVIRVKSTHLIKSCLKTRKKERNLFATNNIKQEKHNIKVSL